MSEQLSTLAVNELYHGVIQKDVYLVSKAYLHQRDQREIWLLEQIELLKSRGN